MARLIIEGIIIVILIGIITSVVVDNFELTAELEAKQTALGKQMKQIEGLQSDLQSCSDNLATARSQARILELYGEGIWFYRSYNLTQREGGRIAIGACGDAPCFVVAPIGQVRLNDQIYQRFAFLGSKFGVFKTENGVDVNAIEYEEGGLGSIAIASDAVLADIPFDSGSRIRLKTAEIDFLLVIEKAEVNDMRVGIGLKEGTGIEGRVGVSFIN